VIVLSNSPCERIGKWGMFHFWKRVECNWTTRVTCGNLEEHVAITNISMETWKYSSVRLLETWRSPFQAGLRLCWRQNLAQHRINEMYAVSVMKRMWTFVVLVRIEYCAACNSY
jgi:hypothetical protein